MASTLTRLDTVVERGADGYPASLERLADPPRRLYVRGTLNDSPKVAIVGARKADPSAIRFTMQLAGELASSGICVISGGAMGIDTAAHQGALDAGKETISVIGSGFSYLYPIENKMLFKKIAEHGALLTEYHKDQPPTKWTFPKRNRIVAAMADAVVVVQAAARSGALITARLAKELGVPVGAVPGLAGDPRNAGNHGLLRQGAAFVEGADDVLALAAQKIRQPQLSLPGVEQKIQKDDKTLPDDPVMVKILEILCARPLHIDDISLAAGLEPAETSAAILALELLGLVEDRGGKNFVRVG